MTTQTGRRETDGLKSYQHHLRRFKQVARVKRGASGHKMDSSRVISDCLRWMGGSIELERLHQKFWGSDLRTVRKGWALHPSARIDILHPLVLIGRGGQFPTIGFEMTRVISTDVASDIIQCTHRQVPMMPRLAARKLTFHL